MTSDQSNDDDVELLNPNYEEYDPVTLRNTESEQVREILEETDDVLMVIGDTGPPITDEDLHRLAVHREILGWDEFPMEEWIGARRTRYCIIDLLYPYFEENEDSAGGQFDAVVNACRRVLHGVQSVDSARNLYLTPEVPMTEINTSNVDVGGVGENDSA